MRRRRKSSPLRKLQNKVWELCKHITRKRYEPVCYTCGADNLSGNNLHTGHMIPKKALKYYLKYDLRILRNQCQKCNLRNEGMGAVFLRHMMEREPKEYVDDIFLHYEASLQDKAIPTKKEMEEYFTKLLDHYKQILDE